MCRLPHEDKTQRMTILESQVCKALGMTKHLLGRQFHKGSSSLVASAARPHCDGRMRRRGLATGSDQRPFPKVCLAPTKVAPAAAPTSPAMPAALGPLVARKSAPVADAAQHHTSTEWQDNQWDTLSSKISQTAN